MIWRLIATAGITLLAAGCGGEARDDRKEPISAAGRVSALEDGAGRAVATPPLRVSRFRLPRKTHVLRQTKSHTYMASFGTELPSGKKGICFTVVTRQRAPELGGVVPVVRAKCARATVVARRPILMIGDNQETYDLAGIVADGIDTVKAGDQRARVRRNLFALPQAPKVTRLELFTAEGELIQTAPLL